jgi:hypothetical protein
MAHSLGGEVDVDQRCEEFNINFSTAKLLEMADARGIP